jgi:hypothetical protein
MARQRIGNRRHVASFSRHNGNQDQTGAPTYGVDSDWSSIIADWPCEMLTTGGGELLRGRQVTSSTTHVLIGDYYGADHVLATDRVLINGLTLEVVLAIDPDGDNVEMRIECKREV